MPHVVHRIEIVAQRDFDASNLVLDPHAEAPERIAASWEAQVVGGIREYGSGRPVACHAPDVKSPVLPLLYDRGRRY